MTFIDATVVNVALPALQADLHATITEVQWVIEAYALFLGALILVGGSMGDQLGRKRVFLAGVAFFTGASIFCGLATSALTVVLMLCYAFGRLILRAQWPAGFTTLAALDIRLGEIVVVGEVVGSNKLV